MRRGRQAVTVPRARAPESAGILIVDDEPPMQERLRRILISLGYTDGALHCASDIAQGKAVASKALFAMALVDLGLPDGNGIELIAWLRARYAALSILAISAWSTEEMILGALHAGASGYLLKERDDEEIAMSIANALDGGAPIDPFIARRILDLTGATSAGPALRDSLTERELAILTQVAQGMSNREIADAVSPSRWNIDKQILHIYAKLALSAWTPAARSRGSLR